MNVIFIIIGLNVTILFLFDKSKLDDKKWFFRILIFNIILFLIASILSLNNIAKNTAVNSLFVPLISQGIYYGLSKLFYLNYEQDSVDTFWTMDKTLFKDGWFNSIFWIISILLF